MLVMNQKQRINDQNSLDQFVLSITNIFATLIAFIDLMPIQRSVDYAYISKCTYSIYGK